VNVKTAAALVISSCLAAACGGGASSTAGEDATTALTAATLGEQTVLAAADYLQQAPYAGADLENGQRLAQMCKACHTLADGGVHMIGPNLFGFFGTVAGSAERYAYSAALRRPNSYGRRGPSMRGLRGRRAFYPVTA